MEKNIFIFLMLLVLLISVNANANPLNVNNENILGGPWGEVTLAKKVPNEVVFTVDAYASAFNVTTITRAWFSSSTIAVPEPGILILLGLSMTAIGIASRYIRKI